MILIIMLRKQERAKKEAETEPKNSLFEGEKHESQDIDESVWNANSILRL